jgi:hypothetical protein
VWNEDTWGDGKHNGVSLHEHKNVFVINVEDEGNSKKMPNVLGEAGNP